MPAVAAGSYRLRRTSVVLLALALLCGLTYANAFGNAFVAGDLQFIVDNDALRSGSLFRTAFEHGYWFVGGASGEGSYYRPWVVLLNGIDYRLYGLHPFGYHLTNTLLHVLACWLVYALSWAVARRFAVALLAASLFAVHPLHVHAVTYVSGRTSVLETIFFLLAALAAILAERADRPTRTRGLTAVVVLAFAGALLCKESAVVLPVLVALLLAREQRASLWATLRRHGRLFIALTLVLFGYLAVRALVLGHVLSDKQSLWGSVGPFPALLTIAKAYLFYGTKLLVPEGVSYLPPFLPAVQPLDPAGLAALVAVVGTIALLVRVRRRWPDESLSVAWFGVTLLPVSGVVPLGHFVKGHYAYLPSVGFCLLVGLLVMRLASWLLERYPAKWIHGGLGAGWAVALASWTLLAWSMNRPWESPDSLRRQVLALEPQIPDELFAQPVMTPTANRFAVFHFNHAQELARNGACEAALPEYDRAFWLTRQRHRKLEIRSLRARCLFELGRYRAAYDLYRALVTDLPTDPIPPMRVAWILDRWHRRQEAWPFVELACARGATSACELLHSGAAQSP